MKIFKKIKKSFVKKVVYYSISNSRLFDKKWYLSQYPEIGKVNPVKHYLKKDGWKEKIHLRNFPRVNIYMLIQTYNTGI